MTAAIRICDAQIVVDVDESIFIFQAQIRCEGYIWVPPYGCDKEVSHSVRAKSTQESILWNVLHMNKVVFLYCLEPLLPTKRHLPR